MNFQERKQLILQAVETKNTVEVPELAALLQVSAITVRRDLAILAEKGLLYRTHGGAMKVSLAQDKVSFDNKVATNASQKEYICRLAASIISEGDVIFMDCGSTVFRLCELIRNLRIVVVTNSLPVVAALSGSEVQVNLAGGEVDMERQAIHGLMAAEHLSRYRADLAFVGVDGISLANGLSAFSEKEAAITLAMTRHARKTILLCDSNKLEKDRYFQFAPLIAVQVLITDNKADEALLEKYRKAGLEVWC